MYRYTFAVGEKVFCCWEYDLPARNARFLSTIDAAYFSYVSAVHQSALSGEHEQRAAIALRAAYHHALETLFTLLGALIQAPDALPAWAIKCDTPSLRQVVRAISVGAPMLTQNGRQNVTFANLSETVHQFCWNTEFPYGETSRRFATLWTRFAADFLDEKNIAEYNSIKHGFRVSSGGSTLRIGLEPSYGVPAPPEAMQTIGSSPHGTHFYRLESIVGVESTKYHFRIRRTSLNWRAEAMAGRLQLLAWSINNVVECLKCLHGEEPSAVQFQRPEDPSAFDSAWQWEVGVTSFDFDTIVDKAGVEPESPADLMAEIESRSLPDSA